MREDVRAKLRTSVKRLLVLNGYPPDKQPEAIRMVIEQMETMAQYGAVDNSFKNTSSSNSLLTSRGTVYCLRDDPPYCGRRPSDLKALKCRFTVASDSPNSAITSLRLGSLLVWM